MNNLDRMVEARKNKLQAREEYKQALRSGDQKALVTAADKYDKNEAIVNALFLEENPNWLTDLEEQQQARLARRARRNA